MSVRYDDVIGSLRAAYEGGGRLLEIGAGTGKDSAYFRDNSLDVVAVDLSPAMVALCKEKGIEAHVMDFLGLDFPPGSFDAVYALNCLLHVPNNDLPAVLDTIRTLMRSGGLFFLGVYGGGDLTGEGAFEADDHRPPRFFSFRSDEQLQEYALEFFEIVDFHVVGSDDNRFRSLTLRRSIAAETA
ncbi:class I SAM-dependent methyltransferase [Nonomuraea sp. B12E4]|uniref:class I SAM-dependent methyltransferase n=1 Tax=Nonomuraea sp. B12E4 TaxID=3153564 RepID=UPI00325DF9F6